jgi:hypothetical protein
MIFQTQFFMRKFLAEYAKKERILFYISWVVKIAIFIVFVTSAFQLKIGTAALALIGLLISFLPSLIEKKFNIIFPPEFELSIAVFLYASFILGEIRGFYGFFPWWDVLLHGISGILFGLIGFTIVYSLYYTHKVVFAPIFAVIFSFTFALAMGALWEIFEFAVDQLFSTNMQTSGLVDTMWDLIIDSIGALIISISGYFYLKGGDSFLMDRFVKKFIYLNRKFLKK